LAGYATAADDAMQQNSLPFHTAKKMPYVMATITKHALRWQQYPAILR